jgi:hypothetical protein
MMIRCAATVHFDRLGVEWRNLESKPLSHRIVRGSVVIQRTDTGVVEHDKKPKLHGWRRIDEGCKK